MNNYINFTPACPYMQTPVAALLKRGAYRFLVGIWDCGFESRRWHKCLSFVSVVCCEVEVSGTSYHSSGRVLLTVLRRCV